jgi:diguanylate cyclase (GGDEF)-like protein
VVLVDAQRRAAYHAAYRLFEAVQGGEHAAAVADLAAAEADAERHSWSEVGFLLAAARTVHALTRPEAADRAGANGSRLVELAQNTGAPALQAMALGLRAVEASMAGDTASLMTDASRAVALLDDEGQPALDRSTGYVIAANAFNTLRLWELVDELYTAAAELGPQAEAPAQASAIAVNRVLIRLEWALALLENGEEDEAQQRLEAVTGAVPVALAEEPPVLWRRDVEACADVVRLLRGEDPVALGPALERHREDLASAGDSEALPLLDAATALALWRSGHRSDAVHAARRLPPLVSASSGARTFPFWARAHVLASADGSAAVRALQEHADLLARLRWESRQAVLAAARAQIAAERRRGEHDRLSHAVNTDPLTGLSNRRPFDAWLERPGPRRPRPSALIVADLDDFKAINDTYGHDLGDEVLRRVGRLMTATIRPGDLAVRLGGDEFALLLEDERLTAAAARQRALDLRAAVAGEAWSEVSAGLVVTVSVGMAVATGASRSVPAVGPGRLYRDADAALYTAKRDGSGLVTRRCA